MKKLFLFGLALLISTNLLFSQSYRPERFWVGPTIGFGIGGGLGFGATGEYGLTDNIGLGMDIGYSSFTEDFGGFSDAKWEVSLFGVLVTGAYHFTPDKQFDPFLKLGLGYFNFDSKFVVDGEEEDPFNGAASAWASGVGFGGQIGARYHFDDQWSGRLALGYPFYISGGVDIAFGGKPKAKKTKSIAAGSSAKGAGASTSTTTQEKSNYNPITDSKEKYSIYLGPYLGANGAINTSIAKGYKPSPGFSGPDAGVTAFVPFSTSGKFGFMLDLGYSKNSYTTYPSENDNNYNTITENISYFQVNPSVYVGGFLIGLTIGSPLSAEAKNADDKDASVLYGAPGGFIKDYSDYLSTRIDLRLGGSITLLNSPAGLLKLNILGSYNLSGVFEDAEIYTFAYEKNEETNKTEFKERLNPAPASLSFGMSYLFRIGF